MSLLQNKFNDVRTEKNKLSWKWRSLKLFVLAESFLHLNSQIWTLYIILNYYMLHFKTLKKNIPLLATFKLYPRPQLKYFVLEIVLSGLTTVLATQNASLYLTHFCFYTHSFLTSLLSLSFYFIILSYNISILF